MYRGCPGARRRPRPGAAGAGIGRRSEGADRARGRGARRLPRLTASHRRSSAGRHRSRPSCPPRRRAWRRGLGERRSGGRRGGVDRTRMGPQPRAPRRRFGRGLRGGAPAAGKGAARRRGPRAPPCLDATRGRDATPGQRPVRSRAGLGRSGPCARGVHAVAIPSLARHGSALEARTGPRLGGVGPRRLRRAGRSAARGRHRGSGTPRPGRLRSLLAGQARGRRAAARRGAGRQRRAGGGRAVPGRAARRCAGARGPRVRPGAG